MISVEQILLSLSNPYDFFLLPSECFKIFGFVEEERKNWQEARKACIGFGGNLVSIHNEKEQGVWAVLQSVMHINM